MALCIAAQPTALVYRSAAICEGCPEAIAELLETSPSNFSVLFVGPDEEFQLSRETLQKGKVFAIGGGPDLDKAYNELKPNAKDIRNFVKNGGRYLGFCLGAFLAGTDPGLNLLPPGSQTDQEIARPKSQVRNESDTVIQVDWKFATGPKAGTVRRGTWLYFQDGPVIQIPKGSPNVTVLATYTSNGDIAASVSPYGKGWVGLVGPHPEATQDWYEDEDITNPDGVDSIYGWDFVEATYRK